MNKKDSHIFKIASEFDVNGDVRSIKTCNIGLINKTYIVDTTGRSYVLQKINTNIFDPDRLMKNIASVTQYMSDRISESEACLQIIRTKSGANFYRNKSGAYRMYVNITPSACWDKIYSPKMFEYCGYAFGRFAAYLDGFDANQLYEVIPKFHDTVDRMKKFKEAVNKDAVGRASGVKREIEFFLARESYCSKITSLLESGEMPIRVTHNDTKLNNILFSKETGKPLAIVDFDTVMPGSVCYDFGDSIRFGCNTASEDEPDISMVGFSEELFESYVKGYLKGFDKITKIEEKYLLWGAILMTYECGMRFLTDYIDGDTYFHTTRKEQNLDRARTQIRMVEMMENKFYKLQRIVLRLCRSKNILVQ